MNSWLSPSLVGSLGWTLVHFLWQGTLVALALAAVLRLLRRHSANARYLAGCIALVTMLAAPMLTLRHAANRRSFPAVAHEERLATPYNAPDAIENSAPSKIVAASAHISHRTNDFFQRIETVFPWLVAGWMFGVMALSLRLLGGWVQIRRLKRNATSAMDVFRHEKRAKLARSLGIARPISLMHCALTEVPTVIGWLKPMILFPAGCLTGLSPAQFEAILAHELAHIRRHDYLVNLLQSAIETLLFYHPAVWWVSRRIREERENCCDDLAVEVCGDRVVYARALAALEEARLAPAAFALAASGSPLLPRIRRLAGKSANNRNCSPWPLAGIVALMLLALLTVNFRGNRALAQENKSAQTNGNPAQSDVLKSLNFPGGNSDSGRQAQQQAAEIQSVIIASGPQTNIASRPGKGRSAILYKLEKIQIDSVKFHRAPLAKVIARLSELSRKNDPEHTGINLFIENPPDFTNAPWMDEVTVTIEPEKTRVKLADVIDAVVKNANHPIRYDVLDYAIVFRAENPHDRSLGRRTFRLGTNFFRDLQAGTIKSNGLQQVIRRFLADAGVDLSTNNPGNAGKQFVWNNRKGLLTVRATKHELDALDTAIQALNQTPPWVNMQTRFVELNQPPDAALLSGISQTTNQALGTATGVLTDKQFRTLLDTLEKRNDVDEYNAPEITTESGRHAQVLINADGSVPNLHVPPQEAAKYLKQIGPILDMIPSVESNRWTIDLKLILKSRAWATNETLTTAAGIKPAVGDYPDGPRLAAATTIPSPIARPDVNVGLGFFPVANVPTYVPHMKQATASVMVGDGQTVMLTGMPIASSEPGSNKCLVVFVTPTLITPSGTRFHPDPAGEEKSSER